MVRLGGLKKHRRTKRCLTIAAQQHGPERTDEAAAFVPSAREVPRGAGGRVAVAQMTSIRKNPPVKCPFRDCIFTATDRVPMTNHLKNRHLEQAVFPKCKGMRSGDGTAWVPLEWVKAFTYLGRVISVGDRDEPAVEQRMTSHTLHFRSLF